MTQKEAAENLFSRMHQNLQVYRAVTKAGGIQRVEEAVLMACLPTPPTAVNAVNDILDEIATGLGCIWSFNHKQRIFYFIPNELIG